MFMFVCDVMTLSLPQFSPQYSQYTAVSLHKFVRHELFFFCQQERNKFKQKMRFAAHKCFVNIFEKFFILFTFRM